MRRSKYILEHIDNSVQYTAEFSLRISDIPVSAKLTFSFEASNMACNRVGMCGVAACVAPNRPWTLQRHRPGSIL